MGMEFSMNCKLWRVTDIGTRTVIVIRVDEVAVKSSNKVNDRKLNKVRAESEGWFNGPPYAVQEFVFDEDDFEACEPVR